MTNSLPPAASATLIVPLQPRLTHWDHHWLMWMPGHSRFECIEVMCQERGTLPPFLWAFFTERNAPKRQVHYMNDPSKAALCGAHVREIEYRTSPCNADGPWDLHVGFEDEDGRAVEWDVTFNPATQMSERAAGLTDQSGHASDVGFLVFFRQLTAMTSIAHLRIQGQEFLPTASAEEHSRHFFGTYSSNVHVAMFHYRDWEVHPETDAWLQIPREDGLCEWVASASPGEETRCVVADGRLERFDRLTRGHSLTIQFDPPLSIAPTSRGKLSSRTGPWPSTDSLGCCRGAPKGPRTPRVGVLPGPRNTPRGRGT